MRKKVLDAAKQIFNRPEFGEAVSFADVDPKTCHNGPPHDLDIIAEMLIYLVEEIRGDAGQIRSRKHALRNK